MTQHIFPAAHAGRPVTVIAGWDRPLRGFHMTVRWDGPVPPLQAVVGDLHRHDDDPACDDEQDDDDAGLLYSNLHDPELIESFGLSPSFAHFLGVLARLDILLPAHIVEQIELDGFFNVGNRVVVYDEHGMPLSPSAQPDAHRSGASTAVRAAPPQATGAAPDQPARES